MDNILELSCWICKELSLKKNSRCFADSYELERTTGLYAKPIVYYVCGVHMQQIHEIV